MSATGLTTFYNSKHRQIYTGHKGGMYVVSGNKKVYGVRAHYKKTTGGTMVSLDVKRRTRKDKGVVRRKKSPVMSILQNPFIRKTRRNAGIPRKKSSSVMSILPNPFLRRVRKNKGTKKGPRKPKAMCFHTRFMYSPGGTMMM